MQTSGTTVMFFCSVLLELIFITAVVFELFACFLKKEWYWIGS